MLRRSSRSTKAPCVYPVSVIDSGRWDISHPTFASSAAQKGVSRKKARIDVKKPDEVNENIDENLDEVSNNVENIEENVDENLKENVDENLEEGLEEVSNNVGNLEEVSNNVENLEENLEEVSNNVDEKVKDNNISRHKGISGRLFVGGKEEMRAKAYDIKCKDLGRGASKKDVSGITFTDISNALASLLTQETKALLYNDVFYNDLCFNERHVNKVYSKLYMYDTKRYGIKVGTKVTSNGNPGKVVKIERQKIKVDFGDRVADWKVGEVLKHANPGQGVVSLQEDQRKFVFFLCSSYATVCVHIANFVKNDAKMTKKENVFVDLHDEIRSSPPGSKKRMGFQKQLEDTKRVNSLVWKVVRAVPVNETVNGFRDPEFEKEGSLLETIGMEKYKDTELGTVESRLMGILGKDLVFRNKNGNARAIIDSVVKSLQASFRLGRLTNIRSAFIPVTTSEISTLLANVEFGEDRIRLESEKDVSKYHGSEALSRASEAVLGKEFMWYPNLPLGTLHSFTREKYDLMDTSLHVLYAKIGRQYDIVRASMVGEERKDTELFSSIDARFQSVQQQFKMKSSVSTNRDGQFGDSRKIKTGRMLQYSHENLVNFYDMFVTIEKNGIRPLVSKVSDEDYETCKRILRENRDYVVEREDEAHLFTDEVKLAAQRLVDKGVTCSDVSLMSMAIFLNDSVSSPCIRPQDRKRIYARYTHYDKEDCLIDRLPDDCKDSASLLRQDEGMTCVHPKHASLEKSYAIFIVLGRALLRLHGHVPDEICYPFDSTGKKLTDYSREHLFREAGSSFLGIPNFGENILRTFQMTYITEKESRKVNKSTTDNLGGIDRTGFLRVVKQVRTSSSIGNRNYNIALESNKAVDGTTLLDMAMDAKGIKDANSMNSKDVNSKDVNSRDVNPNDSNYGTRNNSSGMSQNPLGIIPFQGFTGYVPMGFCFQRVYYY